MLGHSSVIPGMSMRKRRPPTAAQIIFHRQYEIMISGLYLISDVSLENLGTVTTGNRDEDIALTSLARPVAATIAAMADYLADGASFTVKDSKTADQIFDIIQTHLGAWSNAIHHSFNVTDAPMDGLMRLERLAEYLYPYAMRERKATAVESHLYRSLKDMIARRATVDFRQMVETKDEKPKPAEIAPYSPLTEDMTKALEERRGYGSR